jgi:hypothetical protein
MDSPFFLVRRNDTPFLMFCLWRKKATKTQREVKRLCDPVAKFLLEDDYFGKTN